jgi:hypothetical protein
MAAVEEVLRLVETGPGRSTTNTRRDPMLPRIVFSLGLALALGACGPHRTIQPDQIGDLATQSPGSSEDPECDGSDCVCVGAADCFTMASYECTEVTCDSAGCVGHGCSPPSDSVPPAPDPE